MRTLLSWVVICTALAFSAGCFTADEDGPNNDLDFGGGSDEQDATEEPGDADSGDEDDAAEDVDDGSTSSHQGIRLEGSFGAGAQGASRGAGFGLVGSFSPISASQVLSGSGFQLVAAPPVLSDDTEQGAAD